ncbi:MAG: DUF4153 domain-containing protein [Pseudomonadota bacterium]|nr:DUF4153 domain-containing protein [Pseudomonadota bacterium]
MSMQWIKDCRQTCARYPVIMLLAFVAAILVVVIIEAPSDKNSYIAQLLYCVFFTMGLNFGLAMLAQRLGRWTGRLQLLGLIIGAVIFWYLPEKLTEFSAWHVNLLWLLFAAMLLFVSIAPHFGAKQGALSQGLALSDTPVLAFWHYNCGLFHNAAYAGLFVGAMCLGIGLALVSIENLFNLSFSHKVYPQVLFTIAIIGGTYVALMNASEGLITLQSEQTVQKITRFVVQYIQIPLMLIYALIIFAYTIKIMLAWSLPKGWVSAIILAYSSLGIFAFLLIYPLRNSAEKSWVLLFTRSVFISILLMMPLLFIAIMVRIQDYGFTGTRYLGLAFAIWLTGISLYFVLRKAADIRWIPASLFALLLFSLFMPGLNYRSVSVSSQLAQLDQRLSALGVTVQAPLTKNRSLETSEDEKRAIISILAFLADYEVSEHFDVFDIHEKVADKQAQGQDCDLDCRSDLIVNLVNQELLAESPKRLRLRAENDFIALEDGSIVIHHVGYHYGTKTIDLHPAKTGLAEEYQLALKKDSIELSDPQGELLSRIDFAPWFDDIAEGYVDKKDGKTESVLDQQYAYRDVELDSLMARVYLLELAIDTNNDAQSNASMKHSASHSKYIIHLKAGD